MLAASRCVQYVVLVPFSARVTNVINMTERDKLRGIDYFSPRKVVIKIIYGLRCRLLCSLNRNIRSNGHDKTLNP